MKRILTIAIVICLAVTMTCSSFAVDDDSIIDSSEEITIAPDADSVNGAEVPCPYCSDGIVVSLTRQTIIDEDVTPYVLTCKHGKSGYDLYQMAGIYDVLVCDRCEGKSTFVESTVVITCLA